MKLQLKFPKLICSACAKTITEAIQKFDANATVQSVTKMQLIKSKAVRDGKFVGLALDEDN